MINLCLIASFQYELAIHKPYIKDVNGRLVDGTHNGAAGVDGIADSTHDDGGSSGIQARCGLIHEDNGGVGNQLHCDCEAFALLYGETE